MTGSRVASDLASKVADASSRLHRAGERLSELHRRDEQLQHELTETLSKLARVRLAELAGDRIARRLDDADREAMQRLAARRRSREDLVAQQRECERQLQQLADERVRRLRERDECDDAHQRRIEATMQRLAEDNDYVDQRSHTEHLTALAEHANAKADQAEEDRAQKGEPYEQDKLFSYLWKRRYRFPDYRAWPLFRTLDGWVAGLCDYDRAHRDYGMLLEIPVRLRAHAERAVDEAAEAAQQLEDLETAALTADGEPALREALEHATEQLQGVDDDIDREEELLATLQQQIASIDSGNDEDTLAALAGIHAQLEHEDVATLRRDAEATATTTDDALARSVARLRDDRGELSDDLAEARRDHDNAHKVVEQVRDLQRRFRRNRFDSSDSRFGSGFDLGELLSGILHGTLTSGQAWGRMRHHHRWYRRQSTGSEIAGQVLGGLLRAGLSIGSRSSSRGGFGGFGGGSGFGGGGGFRTGGGF